MLPLPLRMTFPGRQRSAGVAAQMIFVCIFGLLIAGEGSLRAQNVQTGHYAPGWNGNLKAGIMAPDAGFYMQSTMMFLNAHKFKDGSGDPVSEDETDYALTAFALVWRPDFKILGGNYQAVVTPAIGNLSGLLVLVNGKPLDALVGQSQGPIWEKCVGRFHSLLGAIDVLEELEDLHPIELKPFPNDIDK